MSENLTLLERDFNQLCTVVNQEEYDKASPGLSLEFTQRFQNELKGKNYQDFEGDRLKDLHQALNAILHVKSTDSTILAIRLSHLVDKRLFGNEDSSFESSDQQRDFIIAIATKPKVNHKKTIKNAILCLDCEGQRQLAIACHQRIPEKLEDVLGALDLRQSGNSYFANALFIEVLRESRGFGRIIQSQARQVSEQAGEIRRLSSENEGLAKKNEALAKENEELRNRVQRGLGGSQNIGTQQLSQHVGRGGL